jgi:two-component system, chemotaxis family, sensor kinase CheA
MNLDSAREIFIAECRDLLQSMEEMLLCLESDPSSRDAVNRIFGVAHTIKGSSGIFGYSSIVEFAHVMESLLDKVRDERVHVDGDLVALLLLCGDHLGVLVKQAVSGETDSVTTREGAALIERLQRYVDPPESKHHSNKSDEGYQLESSVVAHGGEATSNTPGAGAVSADTWHISLRFGPDILRNGMDPLSFIRYLKALGDIVSMTTLVDSIPPPKKMDPECCYLGVEIDFKTDASKQTIEDVFLFLRDSCVIRILPPHSRITDYVHLINQLPEDTPYLGKLLVESGALTEAELAEGLEAQHSAGSHVHYSGAAQEKPALGEILVKQGVVQTEVVNAALEKQRHIKDAIGQENTFIRVHAKKLDLLINLVGELVIANAGAVSLAKQSGERDMHEAISKVGRLVEEIRDSALHLRMVQIGETFNRFRRTVRDTSRELGKEIELVITGAETELDKTIVDAIGDPLMHLVRNAIDHGVESPEVRRERGKPGKGVINLNAYHDSGSVVIEIADDGGGLNKEKIFNKAVAVGLVSLDQVLTEKELFNLIFEPGFSTAAEVTNLSGRGVGMDVVRRKVEALRGAIELYSEEGVGSLARIRLPLSLAIINGFLVGLGNTAWVIPMDMISECIHFGETDRLRSDSNSYFSLRGELVPLLRLRDEFEIDGTTGPRENIVVVQYGEHTAGLVVDKLLGEFQTVVKPLGKLFHAVKGIGGSTILGNGNVALILDVPALIERVRSRELRLVKSAAKII